MFLLYSCLSSVGCWSIEWRMRLKGGLSLHKQSSREPGKSSFLTNKSGQVRYSTTMWNLWRWHMSCLLSELKQILALRWPSRTAVPGHWLWCLSCGLHTAQLSVSWGQAELWCASHSLLLARDMSLLQKTESFCGGFLRGCNAAPAKLHIVWKILSCESPLESDPTSLRGRSEVRNCPAICYVLIH